MVSRQEYFAHERRRHERFTAPLLVVSFDGEWHVTESWSLGGFMVNEYHGRLTPGSLFIVDGIGCEGGELSPVLVRARAVRADPSRRQLMVAFLDLDTRAFAILRGFMAERMRLLREQRLA